MLKRTLTLTYRWARRIVITIVGATVLLIGLAMVVLPGPAIIVIPAGLAILGLEFAWARRWLKKARVTGDRVMTSGFAMHWRSRLRIHKHPRPPKQP